MLTTGACARKRRWDLWVTFNCFSFDSPDSQNAIGLQWPHLRHCAHSPQSMLINTLLLRYDAFRETWSVREQGSGLSSGAKE